MLEVKMALNWNYKGQKGKETLFHTAVGSFLTAMRDWSPAFRHMVTEVLEPAVDEQFSSYGHGTWAALMPATIKAKGGDDTILIRTGEMLGSFKSGGPHNIEQIDRQSLRWGSDLPRSLFHQTGTKAGFQQTSKAPGAAGIPMRKIFDFTSQQKGELRSILVQQLANIARKEGFAVNSQETDPLLARKTGEQLLGL